MKIGVLKENKPNEKRVALTPSAVTKIKKLGYKCTELSQYTGFEEMLDGRVKTLHPKIHAGILHDRLDKNHKNEMTKKKFPSLDLIVVNFYPFQKVVRESKNSKNIIEGSKYSGWSSFVKQNKDKIRKS